MTIISARPNWELGEISFANKASGFISKNKEEGGKEQGICIKSLSKTSV